MINPEDYLRYRNVISRRYQFYYKEMEKILQEFVEDVVNVGATIAGPLFYSIHNVPRDEMLYAEIFMPVQEDRITVMDDMQFHSYFSIEDMISICVFDDFETKTEFAYRMIIDFMEEYGLEQATPFFHIISGDESLSYMFIKAGVIDQDVIAATSE